MAHARRHIAFFFFALAPMVFLLASGCGGGVSGQHSTATEDDAGQSAECTVLPCPSGLGWDPVTCACDVTGVGTEVPDAAALSCAGLRCTSGRVAEVVNGQCACVAVGSRVTADATSPDRVLDASHDVTVTDAPSVTYYDAYPAYDAVPYQDAGPCPFYPAYYCGNGYSLNDNCQCIACSSTCPNGETSGPNCDGCVACSTKCPEGFVEGPNCGCMPAGTTPVTGPGDAGPTCTLEGYYTCSAGSWCSLGTCPDGATQYGCYCDANGQATCQLECPSPPPCTIPGQGTCPYGSQCAYGTCTSGSDSLLVCSCYQGGAYCSTQSCEAGFYGPDAGNPSDSGVTCLLGGYVTCNAGSFCSVGTCPDGTTQYGCFCNEDGTATCDLTCPTPPPCTIPGEGTCPYGSQCTFGTCNGNSGTLLSCSCYGGSASCYTYSCQGFGDAAGVSD